jgi:hypothetical protein
LNGIFDSRQLGLTGRFGRAAGLLFAAHPQSVQTHFFCDLQSVLHDVLQASDEVHPARTAAVATPANEVNTLFMSCFIL